MDMDGGKIIASGSYGCVFYPTLKCYEKQNTKNNEVSKLMERRHAIKEFYISNSIKNIVQRIPRYKNYFIFSDNFCSIKNLTPQDLVNFNTCSIFVNHGITKETLPSVLDNFVILNQPYAGVEISDFITKNINRMSKFIIASIQLLVKGIMPMNNLGVYHFDLKSNNILINKSGLKIIDWGLSQISPTINDLSSNRFVFNQPFGGVVFSEKFRKYYIQTTPDKCRINIQKFLRDYAKDKYYKNYELLFKMVLGETQQFDHFIEIYLYNIVQSFTINEYLPVFLYNLDIWGFLTYFTDIVEIIHFLSIKTYPNALKEIKELFEYVYTYVGKLNIPFIVNKMKKIALFIENKTTQKNRVQKSKTNYTPNI